MASIKSIPLRYEASTDSIRPITEIDERVLGDRGIEKIIADHPSKNQTYFGSLVKSSSDSDSIGSFTNTFYNEAIGTHPGTSLTLGTEITNLYQKQNPNVLDSSDAAFIGADSDGDFWEMSLSEQSEFGARLNERLHTNELGGSFRMSTSAPSSEWVLWENNVFTDSIVGRSDTVYNIYRKNADVATVPSVGPLKLFQVKDVKETSTSELTKFAAHAILYAAETTGVGEYQLRSSAQGAPTDSGTWVSRGVAVDTRNATQNLQYTSITYAGVQYSRQYTNQYSGTYSRTSYADVSSQFTGTRANSFAGSRTYSAAYQGDRTYADQYTGFRQFAGTRTYSRLEEGTGYTSPIQQFQSPIPSVQQFTRNQMSFAGSRPYQRSSVVQAQFTGDRDFAGTRQTNFQGTRSYQGNRTFAGTRETPFSNSAPSPASFSGQRAAYVPTVGVGSGPVTYPGNPFPGNPFGPTGGNVNPGGNLNPGGNTNPSIAPSPGNPTPPTVGFLSESGASVTFYNPPNPPVAGNPGTVNPGGNINPGGNTNPVTPGGVNPGGVNPPTVGFASFSFPTNTLAYFPGSFSGVRFVTVSGVSPAPFNFTGQRFIPYTGQFQGPQADNFTGSRAYAGSRSFAGVATYSGNYIGSRQFTGERPSYFTGTRQFTGSRTYSGQYSREGLQFAGERTYAAGYAGSRTYAADYTGFYGAQYAGVRAVSYTGQYTGQYSSQYTAQYSIQYTSQYTGETLTGLQEDIETYTLYCRVSAT